MRDCPRVVLSAELVRYARGFADKSKSTTLVRELASLAGSLLFWGGQCNYYVGRTMFKSLYDFGGMNVRHFGAQFANLADIEAATLTVSGSERREGWVYILVALSPIMNEGTDKEKVAALIYGYVVDRNVPERNTNDLEISFMQTTALPPFAHKGVTGERTKTYWPESGLSRPWGTTRNEENDSGASRENSKSS